MQRAQFVALALFLLLGCRRPDTSGPRQTSARAPASADAAPSVNAPEARAWSDLEAAWFPARVGELARDAHADVTSFGGPEQPPVASACTLLANDCAKLERLGLRRVLRVPYSGGPVSHARVIVTLLRFESAESSYAYFTGRIADAAEAGKPVFAAIALPGAGVAGETTLLAWKADHVLELGFSDDRLPFEQNMGNAQRVLPPLARAIGEALPGDAALPSAARLLPRLAQKPLSVRYDRFDLAELPGVGPGARALYGEAGDLYELGLLTRTDADAAEDVLETLRKLPGARVLKNAPYRATRLVTLDEKSGRRTAWLFGQRNTFVAGVGVVLAPALNLKRYVPERDPNLRRLKKLLDGMPR